MKKRTTAVAAVGLLALTGCGLFGSPLEAAHEECQVNNDGTSLSYNSRDDRLTARSIGRPADSELAQNASQVYACLKDELDIPNRVQADIEQTSAIQGQRSDSWDGIEAYWTFDPGTGLTINFERD